MIGGDGSRAVRSVLLAAATCIVLFLLSTGALAQDDSLDFLLKADEPEEGAEEEPADDADPGSEGSRGNGAEPEAPEPKPVAEPRPAPGPEKAEASAAPRRVVEEIIVTAQKKEQAITDVPVSISVVDEEFIAQEAITNLQDISVYVPNTGIRSARGSGANIRGFSTSSLNKAFDQSVGLVIDGTPYNRIPYLQIGLFDVQRVEILRGPQGHLLGKNTSAGALNIITKRPTDQFTGFLDVQIGQLQRRRFEGGVGGPLIPGLVNFRVSGLSDQEDGFIRNTAAQVIDRAPPRLRDKNIRGGRLSLEFPDVMGTQFGITVERFDIDLNSSGIEPNLLTSGTVDFFRDFDPNLDPFLNLSTSIDGPDNSAQEISTFIGNWSGNWLGWDLDALASHSFLKSRLNVDFDSLPALLIFVPSQDDNPQTTFEFRAVSPTFGGFFDLERLFGFELGSTDLTSGFFYQNRRLENDRTQIQIDTPLILAAAVAAGSEPASGEEEGNPLSPFFGDLTLDDVTSEVGIESSTMFFEQNANAFAWFNNLEWHFLPKWTLVSGLRFSFEDKKAIWKRIFDSDTHIIFTQSLNWREFQMRDEQSEFDVVPKVAMNYRPTEDVSLFASWTKGVKGGGFNDTASGPSPPEREFDKEKVTQWEIDSRWTLLDGLANANLTLYRMDLEDFQLITSRPQDLVQIVENVGLLRAQGVEADFTYLTTDWLTVIGTLGFNDTEFIDFPFGPCPQSTPDTDGDGDPRCDFGGRPLMNAPKWNTTLTPVVNLPLTIIPGLRESFPWSLEGIGLKTSLTFSYTDVTYIGNNPIDFRVRRPPLFLLNGNLGVFNLGQGWSFTLQAKNITDELFSLGRFEISGLADNFFDLPEPPRTIFGQFRYQF